MKIKVLHLISSPYGLGGAEKLLLDMDAFYDREKFSVFYCNLFNSPQKISLFSKSLNENNLPRFDIPGHSWHNVPLIISRLLSLIRNNDIDIVNTHLIHASIIGSIAKRLEKKHRIVITQHYTQSAHDKFFLKKFDQSASRTANRVIAISSAVKNDLLAHGVKQAKIRVIPNGINLAEFDKEAERKNHLFDNLKKQKKFIIGSVGNLHKRKDHLTLILAMAQVVKKFPNAHLVIIGEGAERPLLEKNVKENKLEENVSLVGFQPNVPSLIKDFNLYVHSSKFEPFGIAILEAMASGKGVIATNVDGVVDIIENESNGFLIPPQNPQMMADFIIRAIENPRQIAEMRKRGRKRVEKDFRIETVVKEYQNLYEEICLTDL